MGPERKVIEVVGGIIRCGNRYLLGRRPFGKSLGWHWELIGGKIELTLIDCEPALGARPTALEHEALGWCTPAEMSALDFCPADAELLPVVV